MISTEQYLFTDVYWHSSKTVPLIEWYKIIHLWKVQEIQKNTGLGINKVAEQINNTANDEESIKIR